MKNILCVLCCSILFCLCTPTHGMELIELNEYQPVPKEITIRLAVYCNPQAKNLLMKLCKSFNKYVKENRDTIIQINPYTVSIDDKKKALFEYIKHTNEPMVRCLLEAKLNPNCIDLLGIMPLHYAIEIGNATIVQLLLTHGANKTIARPAVSTLHDATFRGNRNIVYSLINDNSMDINIQCLYGISALHIATHQGYTEIVQLLLEKNAEVDITSQSAITPLYIASKKGLADIADILIKRNAHVNHVVKNGETLLYTASLHGHAAVVSILLKAGARVHQANDKRETPLYIASRYGQAEVVKLLLAAGAQVHHETKNGDTPINTALEHNYSEIVALLLNQKENSQIGNQPASNFMNFLYCTMSSFGW